MNFEEMWLKQFRWNDDLFDGKEPKKVPKEIWDACKQEVLKIINNQNGQWQEDMMLKYLIDKDRLVKEIEKL
jgi:hypothetical protein